MNENKLLARIIHLECKAESLEAELNRVSLQGDCTNNIDITGNTKHLLNIEHGKLVANNPELAKEIEEIINTVTNEGSHEPNNSNDGL